MSRAFGIELECHLPAGKTRSQLAEAIRRKARVRAACERYNHNVSMDHWKLVDDGSLGSDRNTSAEVVSPILEGEEGIQTARRVVEAIRDFGCQISTKCGLHVHVYAGDLKLEQLRALAINFVHCETAFDAIVPPSRRRDLNVYVLSNRTAFGGDYDNESINKAIDAFKSANTIEQLVRVVSDAGRPHDDWTARYRKLNFCAYQRYKTVEFRQHSGTVEPDKVENWVRLCLGFVDRSTNSRPRQRPSHRPHVPARELAMLMNFVKATPSMRAFYLMRRRELAKADAHREAARQTTQPIAE